ncbi:MAG: hypothetical protein IPH06_01740 [Alphaproteobacteria bacterium]|nr:hypothetical protein [Alphaproteobacteria bacterium]QQS56776.1 MAG: hypothetical protein IPN28_10995 [Alphaproteobacteria bacterium]
MIDKNDIKFSWKSGAEYTFMLPNGYLTYKNAIWTKKDQVLIDGKPIKTNRASTKKTTSHQFEQNNNSYKILFEKSGLISNHSWKCSLYVNEQHIRSLRVFLKGGNKYIGIISIISGIFFGVLTSKFPDHTLAIIAALIVVIIILQKNKAHITYEVIEE